MPLEDSTAEPDAEQIADTMFALSSPARVRIMGFLLTGPHSVSELMEGTGMEQSAVSHQLRILRDHGLVTVEREGRRRMYAVDDDHVAALIDAARRHALRRSGGRVPSRLQRMLRRAN